jgi:lipoic acid synthetase
LETVRSKNIRSPKPGWLKIKMPSGSELFSLKRSLESKNLHTICQDAKCPNLHECWNNNHATFLIMGNICSRNCLFCSVTTGIPTSLDKNEPEKILEMVNVMNLKYAVITSVTRDDLEDYGATHFASVISKLKSNKTDLLVEVLIPDFKGKREYIDKVLEVSPDVLNHNIETVRSLYPKVNRVPSNYDVSLSVLKYAKERGFITKSGIMVGLGETEQELFELFDELLINGVELLTIGQYLQPTSKNIVVNKYYKPDEFIGLKDRAIASGFKAVESGPFVRSSYRAENMYREIVKQ